MRFLFCLFIIICLSIITKTALDRPVRESTHWATVYEEHHPDMQGKGIGDIYIKNGKYILTLGTKKKMELVPQNDEELIQIAVNFYEDNGYVVVIEEVK